MHSVMGGVPVFTATPVCDYRSAVTAVAGGAYRVAIVDLDFPAPDGSRNGGERLLQEIAELGVKISVIVLTGRGSETSLASVTRWEPFAYLEKCWAVHDLLPDTVLLAAYCDRFVDKMPTAPVMFGGERRVSAFRSAQQQLCLALECLTGQCVFEVGAESSEARSLLTSAASQVRMAVLLLGMIREPDTISEGDGGRPIEEL